MTSGRHGAEKSPKSFSLASNSIGPANKAVPETPKADSYPELGIEIESAKPEVLQKLGYQREAAGVVVTDVKPDSPAAEAGLREGMLIAKVESPPHSHDHIACRFQALLKSYSHREKNLLVLVRTPQRRKQRR